MTLFCIQSIFELKMYQYLRDHFQVPGRLHLHLLFLHQGDPQNISNYHPISILLVVYRVAEKWLLRHFVSLNTRQMNPYPK